MMICNADDMMMYASNDTDRVASNWQLQVGSFSFLVRSSYIQCFCLPFRVPKIGCGRHKNQVINMLHKWNIEVV